MTISSSLQRFSGDVVTVGGVIGQRIDLTWRQNLLALDWEADFLGPFRRQEAEVGYVGLGKTLEGLSRLAHHTGELQLMELRQHVIRTVCDAQGDDGYLGIYEPASRTVKLWDVHEQAYMLLALLTDYACFHESRCLAAAERLGHYLIAELDEATVARVGKEESYGPICPQLALIGLDRAMLGLYRETGDETCLRFVCDVLRLPEWNPPIVEGRQIPIDGHMYAYLARCLAQVELYELIGDERLLMPTRRALHYLYSENALVVTGTNSLDECWHSDQTGTGNLGETCATAYLIRLLAKLFCLEGDGAYGDWMERAIYNALFAAQSPDGRKLRYYTPFEGERVYWEKDTYCCPGNYRRIIGELPELIAFHGSDGMTINLYSEAEIQAADLTLRMKTDYPQRGQVRLELDLASPREFDVRLRRPAWCEAFALRVNGQPAHASGSSAYPTLRRRWVSGDVIEISLSLPWRLVRGFRQQEGKTALLRGPMVFCLEDDRPLVLQPESLPEPVVDEARPGGLCAEATAILEGDLVTVTLQDFAAPQGRAVYMDTPSSAQAYEDELLNSESKHVAER